MEENVIAKVNRRFAYRIGDRLPKAVRIIYYVLLGVTLIYWLYRAIVAVLDLIQTIGAFVFEKRNYYTFMVCLLILGIGVLFASQFIFGLDPFGKLVNWFVERWNDFRAWCVNVIGG